MSAFGVAVPRLDFFLKSVQHQDATCDLDGVDCPIRIAIVILDDLQDAGRSKTVERLSLVVFSARLRKVKSVAENIDDLLGQRLQVPFRTADPVQGLQDRRLLHVNTLYLHWYKGRGFS